MAISLTKTHLYYLRVYKTSSSYQPNLAHHRAAVLLPADVMVFAFAMVTQKGT